MKAIVILSLVACLLCCSKQNNQEEVATPKEAMEKVRKAVKLLETQGSAALEVLRDANSEFTWKDSYVFVVNCDKDLVLSNPAFPKREGGDIKQHSDYNGKRYGLELCATASQSNGGWVEYVWLKPGGEKPLRKVSYVMTVESLGYQVGAGVYNETISLKELNQSL